MSLISTIKKILFVYCLILPLFSYSQSSLRLPSILSDHMLLQQNTEVKFWGWANPQTAIKIIPEWASDTTFIDADQKAKWEATLKTPKSGGPYQIKVLTKDQNITINDVMIGELWICSGQSNMERNVDKGIIDAKEVMPQSANPQIRFFFVEKATADYPQDDCVGYWKVCTPESMGKFSSVGYFFGEKLNEVLKTPIGLINSNWGGTPAETWIPEEKIVHNKALVETSKLLKVSKGWDNTIASTYNAMISPLTKMKIAGTIWYQGESNAPNAYFYSALMSDLVQSWRSKFQTDFPFYYVQIAPHTGYPIPFSAAIVREQQDKAQSLEKKMGMVVITDLVDDIKNIHPKYKKQVGVRLANYALAETYGLKTAKYKFATFKEQKIEGDKIRVYFNDAEPGLMVKGEKIEGLEIAGDDFIFHEASGKIDHKNNALLVSSKEVLNPMYVRYAFGNGVVGNIFDQTGLPLAPFRTDSVVYELNKK